MKLDDFQEKKRKLLAELPSKIDGLRGEAKTELMFDISSLVLVRIHDEHK
jgi:hypothetical protein